MRPERLSLSAFGPFAAEQSFDFAALGAHRLFLIHGPTGAGKTTLLDAMCFALFGSSSGDERQAAHLRSQHADAATPTWVEFDFALGGERYRIRRSPAQPMLRKNERLVMVPAKVALWRHEAGAAVLVAEQERRVREEVERLLGYLEREFRQVLMLPQGRFREVLTAAPGDRQAILATLFRTALYHRIETYLADRARAAHDEARQVEARRDALLSEAGAAEPDAAAARVAALAAEHAAAEAALGGVRAAAELAATRLAQARQTAHLLAQAASAEAVLADLVAREPAIAADRARLDAARRAAATLASETLHTAAAEQAGRARADCATAIAQRLEAERRAERATAVMRDATARLAAIETARREAGRLRERARAAAAAESAERRAAEAGVALRAAEVAGAAADRGMEISAGRLEAARTARDVAAALAQTAELRRQALIQARMLADDHASATRQALQLGDLLRQQQGTGLTLRHAAQALASATNERQRAETAARVHHAAHLAHDLRAGTPCPVCGSAEHPAPARRSRLGAPDVEAAVAAEERQRDAHVAAQEAARRAEDAFVRAQDQLAELRQRLPPELDAAAALGSVRQATEAVDAATRAASELPKLVQAYGRAQTGHDAAVLARQAAADAVRERQAALAAEQGAIQALRADAPAGEAASGVLAGEAEALATRADRLAGVLDADRQEQAAAAAALLAATGHAAEAAERSVAAEAGAARRQAEWRQAGHAAGFADPASATAARLAPGVLAALAAGLEEHDRALTRAATLAEQARLGAGGLVAPDLDELAGADATARRAAEAATAAAGGLRERYERAAQSLAAIRAADAALGAARARHAVLRDIADATSGRNDKRLSLEGFVLASILDEALAAANDHLARMLGGRYRVRRREEPPRANAAVGLDIEVLDEWTGMERPAGTLSGGEGFCAALALALGLADTVRAHAGGRRIDTLFIDEGFGALDEDALDTAMDVLTGLQAADRLIGIISHVAELRSRIPAQLVVRPGQRGSSAAFATAR